jgi:hypothetical protein
MHAETMAGLPGCRDEGGAAYLQRRWRYRLPVEEMVVLSAYRDDVTACLPRQWPCCVPAETMEVLNAC